MRVLTIGNLYPPHSIGGYEIVWQSAVEHLRGRGHDVRVLTTGFRLPGVSTDDREPGVHRDLWWYWDDHEWPRLSFRERLQLERHNARVLERHRREQRPEVICWWAMGGMSLSMIEDTRRRGYRSAFVPCDDWLLYGPEVDAWLRAARRFPLPRVLEGLTGIPARIDIERAGPWLVPSETIHRRAAERGWNLGDVTVCHQGVDRGLFRTAPEKQWRGRLLYAGRIDPRKGVDLAVRALEHLPSSSTLRIVGSGDEAYLSELRALIRDRGLEDRVSFERSDQADLPAVYADADVLLFPVRWQEPWGLVPLESMAVGTPVIATGRGGSGEYLRDGENCLIFNPDDGPSVLADRINRLAEEAGLRAALRAGGLETSRRFGDTDFDEAVEALLTKATR